MTNYTTTIGDFFEEATRKLYGGIRFQTENDCDYCPDVKFRRNYYGEVKASGRSGKIILYESRLARELQWCRENNLRLDYVVWRHRAYIPDCNSKQDIYDALACSVSTVIRVPIQILADIAATLPVKTINRWNPLGWNRGWQISVTRIIPYCGEPVQRTRLKVEQVSITDFKILTHGNTFPVI